MLTMPSMSTLSPISKEKILDTTIQQRRKYVGLGNDEASIGVLEGEILKHLWDAGEPQSSVQVFETIYFARKEAKHEMASPSTIAVTLSRMVQKGLLTITSQTGHKGKGRGKGYYAPAKTRAEITLSVLDDTSRRLTGQPLGYLLTCLDKEKGADEQIQDKGLSDLIEVLKGLQHATKA